MYVRSRGGNMEMINDGFNGFLFEVGNADDLYNKVMKLYTDNWPKGNFFLTFL